MIGMFFLYRINFFFDKNVYYCRQFVYVVILRCEAFPSYPRSYDMVHADGLLSLETNKQSRCSLLDLFFEIDRLLRPEVYIFFYENDGVVLNFNICFLLNEK